ncbi:sugar lactone lactonase YvrE [Kribbella sp. VKM Ac-2527]|uniref:Sugar lactone lactonase YvrE n=1 Tax=Kribbella caucasensis TaxID=2512215 RepID=A0A4R6KEB1_9ACTN|nr:SMP-30/gluconolactonase/LRE family protein [Kribbella sp. VKM Ac-2527]TDO48702.1 sugar lactone lactonase YvrE [Kribbella sp. VKM Ac-2527]
MPEVAAVEVVSESRDRLGEAPYWDKSTGELFRVDLLDGIVRAGDRTVLTTGQRTSFAVPAVDGSLVFAQENRIVHGVTILAELPDLGGRRRLNDGKCDPLGRLWVTSYSPTGDRCAGVHLLEPDGSLREQLDELVAGNGIAWDESGTILYVADTADGHINRYAWHPDTGLSDGEIFARIDPADGQPDGLAADAAGGLWVALIGGEAIRRYDRSGAVDLHVTLPVSHPTSVCFGGEHLRELFITTSRHRLPEDDDVQPWAGRLLRLRAPHPGVAVRRFGERS